MAIQATVNVALRGSLGTWFFAFVFTVIQLGASLPPLLAAMSFGLGRTGTFEGFIALLVGQLGMGILIDRFGLFNAPMHAISLTRIGGLLLVVVGVWLAKQ